MNSSALMCILHLVIKYTSLTMSNVLVAINQDMVHKGQNYSHDDLLAKSNSSFLIGFKIVLTVRRRIEESH